LQNKLGKLYPTQPLQKCSSEYNLVQCRTCELIYLSPLPEKETFDELYVDNIQFDRDDYTGEAAKLAVSYCISRLKVILDTNAEYFGGNALKVLEVGAGLSWMSRAAKLLNKDCFTVAHDVTNECKKICNWVDSYVVGELGDKINVLGQNAQFHIISLTHVIEHLPFPCKTISLALPLLDDNGVLFITGPHRPKDWETSRSIERWKDWRYNHVPAHLQYFSKKSAERLSKMLNLKIEFFDNALEEGQSFELWLKKASQP